MTMENIGGQKEKEDNDNVKEKLTSFEIGLIS